MSLVRGPLPPRWPRLWPAVAVVLVFVVSRLVYRTVFDVRFDLSPINSYVQYIDPWFVEHDFLRSVLYLTHQAPLQILFVQGCVKLLGMAYAPVVLEAAYAALGLAVSLGLLGILRRLGAGPLVATVAASVYAASPTFVLYENWLFYPLPTATLIVLSVLALLRLYRIGAFSSALLFFCLLGAVALLRATFGVLFICAAAALVLWRPPVAPAGLSRRGVIVAAAVPLVVVALNAAKTPLLVGHTYGSALLWGNLCTKILVQLPEEDQLDLIDDGRVGDADSCRGPVTDVSNYGAFLVPHEPTGVPLLDLDHVPSGANNPHALAHVLVAERYYRRDALYLLAHYPGAYARAVWDAVSTEYVWSPAVVDGLERSLNFIKLERPLSVTHALLGSRADGRLLALVIGLPVGISYGLYRVLGTSASAGSQRASVVAIAFALLTIGYEAGVTLLVSSGDFNRYRFDVDALYLVLMVLFFTDGVQALRRRRLPWIRGRSGGNQVTKGPVNA